MEFTVEKRGYTFKFRNPKYNGHNMYMEWKVDGTVENKDNDGYFYSSVYMPKKKALSIHAQIDGQEVDGISLPEGLYQEINKVYEEMREADYQEKLNKNIKYVMHDWESYGIYNGISEFQIETIVWTIRKDLNVQGYIVGMPESIAKELTEDKEIQAIAEETYRPIEEDPNWTDEYKAIFRESVKNRTAVGYGMIPNAVIRSKIENIIKREMTREQDKISKENEHETEMFRLARETGKPQKIKSWTEPCNDPKEECSLDIVGLYAMPDGTKEIGRSHTY